MEYRSCYMCEAAATSVEHTPPKCLFPSQKDAGGVNYRVNLITVPSCVVHNSAKSRDDEYLFHALAGSYTSSQLGLDQFLTKVKRAFERAPSKASSFVQRSEPVMLKRNHDDEWEHGAKIIVEADRLDRVLENCARALYFHEKAKKFNGVAKVITAFTMYLHPEVHARVTTCVDAAKACFSEQLPKGENSDIFWYKFSETESTILFLLCFYSTSDVLVSFEKQ
jgi:hypothetical protein